MFEPQSKTTCTAKQALLEELQLSHRKQLESILSKRYDVTAWYTVPANTVGYGRTVCNSGRAHASQVNSRNSQSCTFSVHILTASLSRTALQSYFLSCVTFSLRILKKEKYFFSSASAPYFHC
jgi:hypothetical protein